MNSIVANISLILLLKKHEINKLLTVNMAL